MGRSGICVTLVSSEKELEKMKAIFSDCLTTQGEGVKWGEWCLEDIEGIEEEMAEFWDD